jgi:putative membrane protein
MGKPVSFSDRMPGPLIRFCQRWLIITLGVLVAAQIVPGIRFQTAMALIIASLLLGFLNAFIRPLVVILTLPILMVTFGLFYFVINAGLLWLVGQVVKGFHVDGFWPAFGGALVISFVGFFVNRLLGRPIQTPSISRSNSKPEDKGGPVIDV